MSTPLPAPSSAPARVATATLLLIGGLLAFGTAAGALLLALLAFSGAGLTRAALPGLIAVVLGAGAGGLFWLALQTYAGRVRGFFLARPVPAEPAETYL